MVCHTRIHHCPIKDQFQYGVIVGGEVIVGISPEGDVTGSVQDGIACLEKALEAEDDDVLRCTLAYMRAIKKAKE